MMPVMLAHPTSGTHGGVKQPSTFSDWCSVQASGTQPDILHVHEWHTAGVSLLYWDMYHNMGLTVSPLSHHTWNPRSPSVVG